MTQTELKEQMREDMLQESYCIKEYAQKAAEVFSKPLHPLINPNSKHYDREDRSEIEILEERLTVNEMIGACKFNIFKYGYRKEEKGQKEYDIAKRNTYKTYKSVLESLSARYKDVIVSDAFEYSGLEFRYR